MEILKWRSDVVSFMFYEILPFTDFKLLFYEKGYMPEYFFCVFADQRINQSE